MLFVPRAGRARLALILVLGSLVAPATLLTRNVVAEGEAVLSTNFGRTLAIGYGDEATGTYHEGLPGPCEPIAPLPGTWTS